MTCPATTFDFGEVVRCELPEGHEGLHQGGCIGWRTPAVVENTIARERRIAYGVALEGLGVDFDPDASPLTLLLQVQEETARARELREAVDAYLDASVGGSPHVYTRARDRLRTFRSRPKRAVTAAALAEELIAKVAAMDAEKAQPSEGTDGSKLR